MTTRARLPLADRFWAKVDKTAEGGCWVWTASVKSTGYGQIQEGPRGGRIILAHRWAYETLVGEIPADRELDHMCHRRACVNPAHLRLCTRPQNARNSIRRSNNKSGFKGVSWFVRDSNWVAKINVNGRQLHLGYFVSPELAHGAYVNAAKKYFGEFANSGESK